MQTAEELTLTALSLVFLLLGVVLIASIIFSAFNPYEQIAVGNARKLAAVINQACLSGGETTINFDLPQSVPYGANLLTVLPKWLMRQYGDPNYVIYYESFPPGEAIGWETYHQFDDRLYVILPKDPSNGKWTINEANDFADRKEKDFVGTRNVEATVIGNLVLNDAYNGIEIYSQDKNKNTIATQARSDTTFGGGSAGGAGTSGSWDTQEKLLFGFGSWQSTQKSGGDPEFAKEDFFAFKNYQGLYTSEKTLIKYESCGPYSLCMKTRSGVYSFPLSACKNVIKTVQFVYDARYDSGTKTLVQAARDAAIAVIMAKTGLLKVVWDIPLVGKLFMVGVIGGEAKDLAQGVSQAVFSLKSGDLVLASPCHISQAKISMENCYNAKIDDAPYITPCKSYLKYPLFTVEKSTGNMNAGSYHYMCIDKLETKPDGRQADEELKSSPMFVDNSGSSSGSSMGKCVQIQVNQLPEGFCWTPDPSSNNFMTFSVNSVTKALADTLKFTPVRNAIEYFPATAGGLEYISLRPTRNDDLEGTLSTWGRRFSWGWPGIDSKK